MRRLAQPGEFTLRAFLAGRIDLTQAEAVLGVVDAVDRRQLDVALEQLAGGLSHPLHALRDDLLNLLADLEAGLDFAEEDIRFVSSVELDRRLAGAAEKLDRLSARLSMRGEAHTAARVTLVGSPNVGKSSLFNALARQSAALVSPLPGTTRDYLAARIDAGGLTVELIDTAGRDAECARTINRPRSASGGGCATCAGRPACALSGCCSAAELIGNVAKQPSRTRSLRSRSAIYRRSRRRWGVPPLPPAAAPERGWINCVRQSTRPWCAIAPLTAALREPPRGSAAAYGWRAKPPPRTPVGRQQCWRGTRRGRTAIGAGGTGEDRRGFVYRRHIGPDFQPVLHRQIVESAPPVGCCGQRHDLDIYGGV